MAQQQQRPKTRPRYITETEPITPNPRTQPARYKVDTNRGRKDIEIESNASDEQIQNLANERQQTIIRYKGYTGTRKEITEFTPEPSTSTLLHIEHPDGTPELINSIETPSPDFLTKCEDYADKHQKALFIANPDGSRRYVPALTPETRAEHRKNPPTMSTCPRCCSVSCSFSATKTTPTCRPAKPETPEPETKHAPAEQKQKTKTPPMRHATEALVKSGNNPMFQKRTI